MVERDSKQHKVMGKIKDRIIIFYKQRRKGEKMHWETAWQLVVCFGFCGLFFYNGMLYNKFKHSLKTFWMPKSNCAKATIRLINWKLAQQVVSEAIMWAQSTAYGQLRKNTTLTLSYSCTLSTGIDYTPVRRIKDQSNSCFDSVLSQQSESNCGRIHRPDYIEGLYLWGFQCMGEGGGGSTKSIIKH